MQQIDNKRTTIGLRMATKSMLDRSRAPGQCYDGFLRQLIDMWEEVHTSDELGRIRSTRIFGRPSVK